MADDEGKEAEAVAVAPEDQAEASPVVEGETGGVAEDQPAPAQSEAAEESKNEGDDVEEKTEAEASAEDEGNPDSGEGAKEEVPETEPTAETAEEKTGEEKGDVSEETEQTATEGAMDGSSEAGEGPATVAPDAAEASEEKAEAEASGDAETAEQADQAPQASGTSNEENVSEEAEGESTSPNDGESGESESKEETKAVAAAAAAAAEETSGGEGEDPDQEGDQDGQDDGQDGEGELAEEGDAEEGEDAGEGEELEGEELEGEEEGELEIEVPSPGMHEREVIKNLLAEAYEEENELKEVSRELEQKILLLENFRTRRGSVIGLTSSIVHDIEARYLSSLLSWSEYMQEEARIAQHYQTSLMDLRMKLEEKDNKAMKLEEEYSIFKEEVIKMAEYSRTGKGIPNHIINEINLLEDEKEIEKSKVRSRNIHLQHQLKDLESRLKQKEELAEGLHLIDFEQLKIENQSLNEKIEERNEELLKLRKKTTTTVQVLTHLKEKLQFVQKKNNILDSELGDLDTQLSGKRDKLQREKQSREKARDDTMKLREKSGLVTDPTLLQDVEKQKVRREFLANKVEELQQSYLKLDAELTQMSVMN